MARYKIIYLLLLTYTVLVSAEEAEDRILSLKPLDKLHLQKSLPYHKEQPSFFGKIKNWFFPSSDSASAETRYGGPQYLPPQPYQSQAGCHPCNQEPWVPIASNIGHNTLINFLPPSSHLEDLRPPRPIYGPPSVTHLKPSLSPQYGPPPSTQYGPPPNPVPFPQYGPPPPAQYGPPPSPQFKPPPSTQYGPPPQFRPKPNKINVGFSLQNLNLPPITHLKPVATDYDVPIDMHPPPLTGNYHSLPKSFPTNINYYLSPPEPVPSDSYGAPVSTANTDFVVKQQHLPPLPSNGPIPLPNLHPGPVLPLHNPQNFHDNLPQYNDHFEVISPATQNVQVIPSVKVADFLASVEHPINVIQSPLVEVSVNNADNEEDSDVHLEGRYNENSSKLSEHPIVVDDTHTAASAPNITFQNGNLQNLQTPPSTQSYRTESHEELNSNFIKELLLQQDAARPNRTFTQPPLDYSNWEPTWGTSVQTSMVPPPVAPTTWLQKVVTTTKKPKQIQIIIPYINNKKPVPFVGNVGRMVPSKPYTTLVPMYTPPSSTEEIWSKFMDDFNLAESKRVTATAFTPPTTKVYNIRDLLKDTQQFHQSEKLPYDVISLQNNIDDWTQQEYAKLAPRDQMSTSAKFVPSKQIPDDYFTTLPYAETTTTAFDHEQAGSSKKETKLDEDIETNFIYKESTTEIPTTTPKSSWESASVTVSPLTKEKVYIVTPQPRDVHSTTPLSAWSHPPQILNRNLTKFLVRVDPENERRLNGNSDAVTVVFSEWPHLINNLQTTTTPKPAKHPLLGLMDLSAYTPPPNSTVETISGHSRVVTVVTQVPEKHARNVEPKKKLP